MTHRDENYFSEKYGLTATHSEVLNALNYVKPGRALDLGCGGGRNALWLASQGFDVTAWDKHPGSLARLRDIAAAEGFDSMKIAEQDLNQLTFDGEYDFILSTVVMMFLQPQAIPRLIGDMQRATAAGGYNLIVAAMDSADYPKLEMFPFGFKEGELRDYYAGWEVIKYNEDVGELHRTDAQGNRIKQRFATALMRKA